MNDIENDIKSFIADINNKAITRNKISIYKIDNEIIEFIEKSGFIVENSTIILTVRRYKHMIRDFKKDSEKAISNEDILNLRQILKNPYAVYFDIMEKHQNLLYIFKKNKVIFKIVVSLKGEIITAGKINKHNLKDKHYKKIR